MDEKLNDEEYRKSLIDKAVALAHESNRFSPNISIDTTSKKPIYTVNNLPEKLVLRKCAINIKKAARIRYKHRTQIIKEIKIFLKDGAEYRIYRLDISAFFESCNPKNSLSLFLKHKISTQTLALLESFLSGFNKQYSAGIPRGIETSPILADLSLIDFDSSVSGLEDVFYYSRFVDDVFIITSCVEDKRSFLKTIRKYLPDGLNLNHNKTTVLDVQKRSCGMVSPIAEVDYLGYRIFVFDTDLSRINSNKPSSLKKIEYRRVSLDFTDKKTKRIMGKISKSFYSFSKNSDYALLRDRLVFLSTNRDLINKAKHRKIPTGIYYSHSEVDLPSNAIERIDKFLKVLIISPHGRVGAAISGKLSKLQKKDLLKISFSNGFKNRVFKRFSPNRLGAISRIW